MIIKWKTDCCACLKDLLPGEDAYGLKIGKTWCFLCKSCREKVTGYRLRKVVEAVMLSFGDPFGGPDCELDHHDYDILELLNLHEWPT